jgi:hypothetical protein
MEVQCGISIAVIVAKTLKTGRINNITMWNKMYKKKTLSKGFSEDVSHFS